MNPSDGLVLRTRRFSQEVGALRFTFEGYIYNPLDYAWSAHELYLRRYVHQGARVLMLGMNPGPFGMAQTGVPFGEVNAVRDWMGIEVAVRKPEREHPARPIVGFAIARSEVSGQRLWGLMQERFGTAQRFFSDHAVMNYCPLVFVDSGKTGKNIVPEKLPKLEREALERLCDDYLAEVIDYIRPGFLVGIGKYAEAKLQAVVRTLDFGVQQAPTVLSVLHPSPGNPQANAGWGGKVAARLEQAGVW
jgi:single-strand selective monofunctional uracil DNA glycosylase